MINGYGKGTAVEIETVIWPVYQVLSQGIVWNETS